MMKSYVIVTSASGMACDKNKNDGIQKECRKVDDDLNDTTTIVSDNNDHKRSKKNFQCGIYLATSSIPNAGFGLYTTRSIAKNELVQQYPEAPSITVVDFYVPSGNEEGDWNHVDYIWESSGVSSYEGDEISESVMTFGSLCNYHPVSLFKKRQ